MVGGYSIFTLGITWSLGALKKSALSKEPRNENSWYPLVVHLCEPVRDIFLSWYFCRQVLRFASTQSRHEIFIVYLTHRLGDRWYFETSFTFIRSTVHNSWWIFMTSMSSSNGGFHKEKTLPKMNWHCRNLELGELTVDVQISLAGHTFANANHSIFCNVYQLYAVQLYPKVFDLLSFRPDVFFSEICRV